MQEITMEIALDGKVKLSVKGVKGKACKDFTKKLEEALGSTTEDKLTNEYYTTPQIQHVNQS